MFELKNVTKRYRLDLFGKIFIAAVDNVSFTIPDGKIFSLIGESGSGKTTIGKLILKLIKPSAGTLIFENEDVTNLKESALKKYYSRVQGVFQDPFSSLNPIFKADRVFSLVREEFFNFVSKSQWHEKTVQVLHDVGLNPAEVLGKYPHQLSGGQLQRFLIARALLLEVKFLVADEIISMLDASTRIDVLNLLFSLKKKGLSILFITHDLNLGYYISDSILIMYKGAMVEMGETKEIFNNPLHPYTQLLLDSVPRLDKKWDAQTKVKTEESLFAGESRCKFIQRCKFRRQECSDPRMIEVNPNHLVCCVQYKK
ncbi:MAG: ABC transporter ATP-binding protein [Chitinivibrionales bacterium]|nr:ABC transporter ATP-binding protein [Chitinivibrionales bacterium]